MVNLKASSLCSLLTSAMVSSVWSFSGPGTDGLLIPGARLKLRRLKSFVFGATMKRRKKTHPTTRLIEAMLDIALLAGFISAMGILVRLAFW